MNYQPGTVLEPSVGIGNFFGLLPKKLAGAKLHGVELDGITGRIAQQLYPQANITIRGFEKTNYPGGIVAFVTSCYTMDSQNPATRQYLAQRAELLGAVRLPNNAFKANAGTTVVSDILFFQKRDHLIGLGTSG